MVRSRAYMGAVRRETKQETIRALKEPDKDD